MPLQTLVQPHPNDRLPPKLFVRHSVRGSAIEFPIAFVISTLWLRLKFIWLSYCLLLLHLKLITVTMTFVLMLPHVRVYVCMFIVVVVVAVSSVNIATVELWRK